MIEGVYFKEERKVKGQINSEREREREREILCRNRIHVGNSWLSWRTQPPHILHRNQGLLSFPEFLGLLLRRHRYTEFDNLSAVLSVFATKVGFEFGRTLRDSRNTGGLEYNCLRHPMMDHWRALLSTQALHSFLFVLKAFYRCNSRQGSALLVHSRLRKLLLGFQEHSSFLTFPVA